MRTPKPFYRRFNDTWYVQIGKKQIPLVKGENNETAAYQRYFQVMSEQPIGLMPDPLPNATVAAVCDLFLEWCTKHVVSRSRDFYDKYLQDFCAHVGRIQVSDLKPYHVTKWLDLHSGWKGSRRCAVIAVKRAFNWACSEGLLGDNPLKSLKKPPAASRERVLSAAERQAIFDNYPKKDPFRDFLVALQETGARPGEVATVTAEQVDLTAGIWELKKHKTAGKTKRSRIIILTPVMVELSRRLVAKYPEGPLFRNRRGKSWSTNTIRCRFRRIRKKLKLGGDVVSYLYRHSFCTDALENGVGVVQVAELLGHVNTNMVMKHYQHLRERREHLRQAAVMATRTRAS